MFFTSVIWLVKLFNLKPDVHEKSWISFLWVIIQIASIVIDGNLGCCIVSW